MHTQKFPLSPSSPIMKYDVFISYSRKDYVDEHKNVIEGNIISKIKELLDANGYTYWLDEEGISAGDEFTGIITEAIINSEIFLFISSKNSNASKWTIHEIAVAKMLDKKTIPFRVDNTIYDKSVLMYLAPLDYIDYGKNPSKAFQALLLALNNYMDKKKEAERRKLLEEQKRLQAMEEAKAKLKAEEEKKQRLSAIDHEIQELKNRIDGKNAEKAAIQANIVVLQENLQNLQKKINECVTNISDIDESISSHNHSIALLEKEKESLLGINKASQSEEKQKPDHPGTDTTQMNKSLAVHYSLLLVSICTAISFCFALIAGMRTSEGWGLLIPTTGAVAGIIQLLRKNRNGILILFLNGILGYFTAMFMVSNERLGWGFVFLVYQLVVFGLYKYHQYFLLSEYSWANMKGVWVKLPTRFFLLTTLVSWAVSYIIPFLFVLNCGCNFSNYSFNQADSFTRYCIGTVYTSGYEYEKYCRHIAWYYDSAYDYYDILTKDSYKAEEWYRRGGWPIEFKVEDEQVQESSEDVILYSVKDSVEDEQVQEYPEEVIPDPEYYIE